VSTNFPTSLDNTDSQKVTDGSSVIVAALPNNLLDMVEALEAKVGADNSAVTTSHDYKIAHKGVFSSGSTVFNTTLTAAGTWQDLNLCSVIGANVAFVHLQIQASSACYFAVQPKGYGSSTVSNHYSDQAEMGGCCFYPTTSSKVAYMTTFTDSSGVIQIGCNSSSVTITIKLIGYARN